MSAGPHPGGVRRRARLHVMLGQGGVGKTTLASAYAVALAQRGLRVGLLGVDPAGRLRDALGMRDLPEVPTEVPSAPGLRAALLRPTQTLRRWAAEELGEDEGRLTANPFFITMADRLAAATDALAAMRVAEWTLADGQLDHLIVDTAPGLHGLDFLARPEKLLTVLHGRLFRWLSAAAGAGVTERAGRRVLRGLGRIAGQKILLDLSGFSLLIEKLAPAMLRRLELANQLLREPGTELLLVCAARPGSAANARALAGDLRALGLTPGPAVLNRALPHSLLALPETNGGPEARAFRSYVTASARLQAETARELAQGFRVLEVPLAQGLATQGPERLAALGALGKHLLAALDELPPGTRRA